TPSCSTSKVSRVAAVDQGFKFGITGNSAAPACYWTVFGVADSCDTDLRVNCTVTSSDWKP
ncbi:MAG: hypothetical protein RJS97_00815, partial [Parvibaculaceae bacterium]